MWCYFNTGCIEQIREEFPLTVTWRAYPFHPDTPPEGTPLSDLIADPFVDMAQVMERMKRKAGELNLPLGNVTRSYNTRLAQELGKWAEERHRGEAFQRAVFEAYFVRQENISIPRVLAGLAGAAGLSGSEALEIIEARAFREAVDRDWERSRGLEVQAAPTFFINGRRLVGAQSLDRMRHFINKASS
ncbi:MAG: thioredoxin domain-containing protein [Desulfobacteraceae bacterium]|nr:thioredoxin domain-containing protein [Desulfobacteraceae bacterium]